MHLATGQLPAQRACVSHAPQLPPSSHLHALMWPSPHGSHLTWRLGRHCVLGYPGYVSGPPSVVCAGDLLFFIRAARVCVPVCHQHHRCSTGCAHPPRAGMGCGCHMSADWTGWGFGGGGVIWSLPVRMLLPLAHSPRVLTHGVHGGSVCALCHATAASGGLALCLAPEVRDTHRVACHCWCLVFHKHSLQAQHNVCLLRLCRDCFGLTGGLHLSLCMMATKSASAQLQFCCWQSLYCKKSLCPASDLLLAEPLLPPPQGLQACVPHTKRLAGVG